MAPTKPLVAQQIDACHQTCGIPGSDAAELTGQIAKPIRGRLVSFFCQPLIQVTESAPSGKKNEFFI